MIRIILHTAISAALTLVTFYSSPGLAADRDNSGKQIKRFEFVAPKAPVAQLVPPKAQFVAPKAGRTGSGLGSTTVFRLTPKAPPAGSSTGSGTVTAQFVAPKAKKAETEVIAKVDTPAKPLLLAPATTSTTTTVDQAAPAPKAVAEATPETAAPDAGALHATPREVELAYLRAAARYGYGAYVASYSEDDDEGSYDDGTYDEGHEGAGYGDEGCF
jgi:hypothetical protein